TVYEAGCAGSAGGSCASDREAVATATANKGRVNIPYTPSPILAQPGRGYLQVSLVCNVALPVKVAGFGHRTAIFKPAGLDWPRMPTRISGSVSVSSGNLMLIWYRPAVVGVTPAYRMRAGSTTAPPSVSFKELRLEMGAGTW